MEKIIIVGGGGHAKVLTHILKQLGSFEIVGYVDQYVKESIGLGIPYLGDDSQLYDIRNRYPHCSAVIGVGNINVSNQRARIKDKLEELGFKLPVIVSKTAIIADSVRLGNASFIADGAIVGTGTEVGQCVIVNTASSIDHDCVIEDFVHIAPGVTICGGVSVGKNSFVGAGAVVIQGIKIGTDCLIGAGSVVVDHCVEPGTYVGIPARKCEPA